MRKEDIASLVVYAIMIALAIIIGFTVLMPIMNTLSAQSMMPFNNSFLFAIIVIVVAIIFTSIFIELAHFLGAKIGSYKIVMFNIMGLAIYRKNGKMKLGFKGFDGLTGETKIVPKKETSNPKAYCWFPILFFILEIVAVIIISVYVSSSIPEVKKSLMWLLASAIMFACIGGIVILYNYVPVRLDSMNDGYRLSLLGKPVNKVAFNEMLKVEYAEFEGNVVETVPFFNEITDFTARVDLIRVYQQLGQKDYTNAIKSLELIVATPKNINADTYNSAQAQIVSIMLLKGDNPKDVEQYYNSLPSYTKKAFSEASTIECDRAYLTVSGLIENSEGETNYAYDKFSKCLKKAPEGRINVEKELYTDCLNLIKKVHSDWKIGKATEQQ